MILLDAHGNRVVRMADGAIVPLVRTMVHVEVTAAIDNEIMAAADVIAVHQTCAQHWFAKYTEAQQTIADLREQLAKRPDPT